MKISIRLFLLAVVLGVQLGSAQRTYLLASRNVDSLAAIVQKAISAMTSPAMEERKRIRRNMQREGYANVLIDALSQDGLMSLISFLKTQLHIEYAISHRPIIVNVPIVGGEGKTLEVALPDDWGFPVDPWKKE
jgi:hypothetical protein